MRAVVRGIAEEFASDLPVADLPLVSIDVEATGLDPNEDRVVEVAAVVFHRGQVERHSWLINPGRPIGAEAQAVHQISDDDVKDAPPFAGIVAALIAVLERGVPLAYNAEFDRAFLLAELARTGHSSAKLPPALRKGVDWLDPLIWARELQKDEKSKSLSSVAERLGIEIGQAHRAADDATAAGHVFRAFISDTRVPPTYAACVQEQRRLGRVHRDERAYWRS